MKEFWKDRTPSRATHYAISISTPFVVLPVTFSWCLPCRPQLVLPSAFPPSLLRSFGGQARGLAIGSPPSLSSWLANRSSRRERRLVGLSRFELLTPRLSSVCSNQLSYTPDFKEPLPILSNLDSACGPPMNARSI